jgi:hypothetical protein
MNSTLLLGHWNRRDPRRERLAPLVSDLRAKRKADGELSIRRATARDTETVERLATLDSARVPEGELLIAEVDGEAVAAAPVEGGRPVADPFRRTAEIVSLLELRAAQLRATAAKAERSSRSLSPAALPREAA